MICKVKHVDSISFVWQGTQQIWVINGIQLGHGVYGVEIKSKASEVLEVFVHLNPEKISNELKEILIM